MEALDEFLAPAAANVALPLDQLKYLICLMSCYPLAFGLRFMLIHKVPSALVHLFSIVLSLTFTLFSLGPWAIVHFVAQSGGVYLLLLALPRNLGYKFAYGFAMGYLTLRCVVVVITHMPPHYTSPLPQPHYRVILVSLYGTDHIYTYITRICISRKAFEGYK
eukprot:TRINITY_DN6102_c0_g1_i1.p1 TRINITY_DN6102_c0_g1~~TRINITY_DN6102_c0_g1_i1.p1  ORF type:complete len:163 (+),score=15.93 TRINITY_DN6102_c0_g1_i1:193-681(+)